MANPVFFYTDDPWFRREFIRIRKKYNFKTHAILVNRTSLWSFGLVPNISRIFQHPDYPKFPPNTVNPSYVAVMHAKFELMENTIIENQLTDSSFLIWLDIGALRDNIRVRSCGSFNMPPGFNESMVARWLYMGRKPMDCKKIIARNAVWIGGHIFMGTVQKLKLYIKQYKTAVNWMLSHDLMSTDQQVIYCLYSDKNMPQPLVETQIYVSHEFGPVAMARDPWFYLCYVMRCKQQCPTTSMERKS